MSLLVYSVTQSASALCIELLMFCPTQQTHTVCNREYCGGIGATWEIKLHSRQQIPSGRVWIPTDAVATREVTPGHFCHHLRIFKDSKVITTVHFLHHLWNQDIIQDVYEFVKKEWDDFMHSFFPFFNTTSITILVVVMKNDKGARSRQYARDGKTVCA